MRTIEINVYKYDELDAEAKEAVKRELMDIINNDIDFAVLQTIKERLEREGLSSLDDIRYSLNYTQGGGVAFYGEVDLKEFAKVHKTEVLDNVIINVVRKIQCNDSVSMELTCLTDDLKRVLPLKRVINKLVQKTSKELEGECYEIQESYYSDEYIKDFCNENFMEFLYNGVQICTT